MIKPPALQDFFIALTAVYISSLSLLLPHVSASSPTCEITPAQQQEIEDIHNSLRSTVYPPASNMRRMFWSQDLADIAQDYANQCIVGHSDDRHSRFTTHHSYTRVGENIDVLHQCDSTTNYTEIIQGWYKESYYYDFYKRRCNPFCTCDRYLQIVWAQACEVGCAIAYCSNPTGYSYNDVYLLVCNYAPGPPADYMTRRPYRYGEPCYECGEFYSCKNNLCYNSEEACVGSDPHFGIRLHEGSLLCYTFQGEQGSTFNLVSNSQLEMNALFVPDAHHPNNTWIGSIGITIYHNGKKMTSLEFTADDQMIHVGARVKVDAKTVKKLSFNRGKLTVIKVPHGHSPLYPRVGVEFLDSDLEFTVAFVKDQHLDLLWHSIGETYKDSRGVVGQFFHNGVRIDEEKALLYIPKRRPIPIVRHVVWDFIRKHTLLSNETECWTSVVPSNQGEGIVDGDWTDYKVEGLLAIEH